MQFSYHQRGRDASRFRVPTSLGLVCAWCGVSLPGGNTPPEAPGVSPLVTHGICPRCREEFIRSAVIEMDAVRSLGRPADGVS